MDPNTSPSKRHVHPQMPIDQQQFYQQHPQQQQYAPNPYNQPFSPQQQFQQQQQPAYGQFGAQYNTFAPQPTVQPTDAGISFFGAPLPATQLGLHLGNQAFAAGTDYMNKNIDKLVQKQKLKAYFNVTNSYVFQKLLLLAFPFRHKSWQRLVAQQSAGGHTESYASPRDDVNAPDLYIPTMAVVSYVLLSGLAAGLEGKFHPKVLGETATMVAILSFIQWGCIKLGLYLLNIGADLSSLDILALIGYNYTGIIAAVSAGLLAGFYGRWSVFAYSSLTMFFFVMRSLRQNFLPDAAEALIITQRRRRVNFLFGMVCLQIATAVIVLLFK